MLNIMKDIILYHTVLITHNKTKKDLFIPTSNEIIFFYLCKDITIVEHCLNFTEYGF